MLYGEIGLDFDQSAKFEYEDNEEEDLHFDDDDNFEGECFLALYIYNHEEMYSLIILCSSILSNINDKIK